MACPNACVCARQGTSQSTVLSFTLRSRESERAGRGGGGRERQIYRYRDRNREGVGKGMGKDLGAERESNETDTWTEERVPINHAGNDTNQEAVNKFTFRTNYQFNKQIHSLSQVPNKAVMPSVDCGIQFLTCTYDPLMMIFRLEKARWFDADLQT